MNKRLSIAVSIAWLLAGIFLIPLPTTENRLANEFLERHKASIIYFERLQGNSTESDDAILQKRRQVESKKVFTRWGLKLFVVILGIVIGLMSYRRPKLLLVAGFLSAGYLGTCIYRIVSRSSALDVPIVDAGISLVSQSIELGVTLDAAINLLLFVVLPILHVLIVVEIAVLSVRRK